MCFFARWKLLAILLLSALLPHFPSLSAQERQPTAATSVRKVPSSDAVPQTSPVSEPISDESGGQTRSGALEQETPEQPSAPDPSSVNISGTVKNINGDIVPNATITLEGLHPGDRRTTLSSDGGAFQFAGLQPGLPYRVMIEAKGLQSWNSQPIVLSPGQFFLLNDIMLKPPPLVASVTVYATREQIATEQVTIAEKQRVFGIIPNFYVTYDPNPVPLTTALKFKLAFKADTDVMTFVGVAFMAGIYQAADMLDYGQGAEGYAKRVGAGYADTTTDVFLGGAILPWLFRQDPRYFYQGTGTKKSRLLHAMASPFVCKGDNGKTQVNYSSMGGDLGSGAISNLYYPESNRGVKTVFGGFGITTGIRIVDGLAQEFILRNLTPAARRK
jgi:Carboxypeptidase regulatory-like domain